jgi:hypothetical protein
VSSLGRKKFKCPHLNSSPSPTLPTINVEVQTLKQAVNVANWRKRMAFTCAWDADIHEYDFGSIKRYVIINSFQQPTGHSGQTGERPAFA